MAKVWPFVTKIWSFFSRNWQFWRFLAFNFQNAAMNLPNFWYGSLSDGPLSENHTLYDGKILTWRNLVHLTSFLGQNWQLWEFFTYNFQTLLWIFLIFCIGVVLRIFLENIICYMPGKFKDVQNLAIFDQISALLWVFSLYIPKIVMLAKNSPFDNFFRSFVGRSWCFSWFSEFLFCLTYFEAC